MLLVCHLVCSKSSNECHLTLALGPRVCITWNIHARVTVSQYHLCLRIGSIEYHSTIASEKYRFCNRLNIEPMAEL